MRVTPLIVVFLPILIILTATLFWGVSDEPEEEKTQKELALALLEDITFNKPPRITVLLMEQYVDKKTRVRFNNIVFKTDEEFLAKSPKNFAKASDVLEILKTDLPDYNFGNVEGSKASYARFLIGNAEWTVSSLENKRGYFSKWVKKVDVHQLLSEKE